MGRYALGSSVSYQSTIYHINTDVDNNDDPPSFETPRKNNRSSSSLGDTINTTATKIYFKTEGLIFRADQCTKSRALNKVTEKYLK